MVRNWFTARRWSQAILWIAAIVLIAGCATIENKARSQKLQDQVKAYTKAIRWGDYDIATRFLKHQNGEPASTNANALKGVRVTHYDYSIDAGGPEAVVANMIATFDYQLPASVSVRQLKQRATWWYDDKAETWFMDGSLPKF